MPCGSVPSIAALTRSGARKASAAFTLGNRLRSCGCVAHEFFKPAAAARNGGEQSRAIFGGKPASYCKRPRPPSQSPISHGRSPLLGGVPLPRRLGLEADRRITDQRVDKVLAARSFQSATTPSAFMITTASSAVSRISRKPSRAGADRESSVLHRQWLVGEGSLGCRQP
jgi:hypothetical protein